MKKPILLILTLYISMIMGFSQNLVPNPSFEKYKQIHCDLNSSYFPPYQNPKAVFDSILYDWTLATRVQCTLFSRLVNSECNSFASKDNLVGLPKDGNNMAEVALLINYWYNGHVRNPDEGGRSYVQTKLSGKLKAASKYLSGGYYAKRLGEYAANNMGMLFTEKSVETDTTLMLKYKPQVNQSETYSERDWRLFFGCFIADGQEEYLTVGGFIPDGRTSVLLTAPHYDPGEDVAIYFLDSIFVEEVPEPHIPNVITPSGDCCNEKFQINNIHFGWWELEVYNRWGKQIYESKDYRNTWDGGTLSPGVYFYELRHKCESIRYKGTLTIIR